MKKCLNCKIELDGDRTTCPICQGTLSGTPSEYNWVPISKLKKKTMFYKCQLFLVLCAIVVSLALDFLLELNNGVHYSLIITCWCITLEVMVKGFFKRHAFPAKILSVSAVTISVLVCLTSWYLDYSLNIGPTFFGPTFYIAIPCIIGATILANFIFSMIDRHGNALVYLLCTILIGIIPYIAIYIGHKDLVLPWAICLIISIIAFIGLIVFKGRTVLTELQKRFNF